MEAGLIKLKNIIKESAFSRSPNYTVNVQFKDLFSENGSLLLYNEHVQKQVAGGSLTSEQIIKHMTPSFQRDNTKWTQEMQKCFIENLLCGCETKIQLYDVIGRGSELAECLILDGLQRLTAMSDYQSGAFPIFNDLYWDDIKAGGVFPRLRLLLNIFQFDSDETACEFYIQMNRGMTHSEEDLKSAFAFLNETSSLECGSKINHDEASS